MRPSIGSSAGAAKRFLAQEKYCCVPASGKPGPAFVRSWPTGPLVRNPAQEIFMTSIRATLPPGIHVAGPAFPAGLPGACAAGSIRPRTTSR
jgi:hypothetical protein